MKKLLAGAVVVLMLVAVAVPMAQAAEKGGVGGLLYGCCFGVRGAAAYNDGKSASTMEWLDALLLGHIWAAIEGAQGTTTADLRKRYGDACY